MGKSYPIFWDLGKSSMKLNSVRAVANWDGEVLTTWMETFLNVKRNSIQLKRILSYDEGKLTANYPKILRFTYRFREKIVIKLSRFTHKIGEKIAMNL